jgi:predicted DNA binding CopG/RHH family protein
MGKRVNMGTKPSAVPDVDDWVAAGKAESVENAQPLEPISESMKMKRLTLDIPEDLHKAIKTRAVVEGVPMANMLRSLLEQNYGNQ